MCFTHCHVFTLQEIPSYSFHDGILCKLYFLFHTARLAWRRLRFTWCRCLLLCEPGTDSTSTVGVKKNVRNAEFLHCKCQWGWSGVFWVFFVLDFFARTTMKRRTIKPHCSCLRSKGWRFWIIFWQPPSLKLFRKRGENSEVIGVKKISTKSAWFRRGDWSGKLSDTCHLWEPFKLSRGLGIVCEIECADTGGLETENCSPSLQCRRLSEINGWLVQVVFLPPAWTKTAPGDPDENGSRG